jgi:Asp-tRNA(Asn)/Glu-tRNA(Gln) amidotransferase A subunit family amidase
MSAVDIYVDFTRNSDVISITNLTGQPAVTVPHGVMEGKPTNVILVGKPHAEVELLALAKAHQDPTACHPAHPRL